MRNTQASLGTLAVFLFLTAPPVRAQDTLSPKTPCYADILGDWKDQDNVTGGYRSATAAIIKTLPAADQAPLQAKLDSLAGAKDPSPETERLYVRACSARRAMRMRTYIERMQKIVFSQHKVMGGGYFNENVWRHAGYSGKGVELLTMTGRFGALTHLLPDGEARDIDVSFDGTKILFSWRGGGSGTSNYKIYEMDAETKVTRAITKEFGGIAGYQWGTCDYEGIYLPNGNILFASSRTIQEIDCTNGPAVNFFLCDKDGKYLRRICFDQVPTDYPQVLPDGRVVFCRWDYNDKTHTYAHALFVMKPDGTEQKEYCNNNSWWPTMILQQRPIPGTTKLMAMIGGYHTKRQGKIGIIDVNAGMENGEGITLLAPVRLPKNDNFDTWGSPNGGPAPWRPADAAVFPRPGAAPLDKWGQKPPMFAYPYPFDENAFLVSFRPESKTSAWEDRFGLYFMLADGKRELLWYDAAGSCCGAVVLAPRTLPPVLSSTVDYRQTTGTFQIMNLYDPRNSDTPLLKGIDPRIVKKLRVAGLDYRSGPEVGNSAHFGAGCINFGGATYHTPISVGSSSWDVKKIIGETPVLADGSVNFTAPARTPLFFQLLDSLGNVVQTMRSWTMVQPGETFSCMGCHESKLQAPPPPSYVPLALKQPPLDLTPFYGPPRGFSFAKEIQPIFNAKCVKCHSSNSSSGLDLTGVKTWDDGTARSWLRSYSNLVKHASQACSSKYVNWFPAEDSPLLQPPYRAGACRSPLVTRLAAGHKNLTLTREEMDKIRCWIDIGIPHSGTYSEGMSAADSTKTERNLALRRAWETEEQKNIQAYITAVGLKPKKDGGAPASGLIAERWTLVARAGRGRTIGVAFTVPATAAKREVSIALYTLRGALAGLLFQGNVEAGRHSYRCQHRPLAAGQYLVCLKGKGFEKSVPVPIAP